MDEIEEELVCESCDGSGDCSECNGTQFSDETKNIECEVCQASGLCEECHGDGAVEY